MNLEAAKTRIVNALSNTFPDYIQWSCIIDCGLPYEVFRIEARFKSGFLRGETLHLNMTVSHIEYLQEEIGYYIDRAIREFQEAINKLMQEKYGRSNRPTTGFTLKEAAEGLTALLKLTLPEVDGFPKRKPQRTVRRLKI